MRRGWAALTDKALMLSKCVMRRQWGSQTPLRQFKGIPTEILSKVRRSCSLCCSGWLQPQCWLGRLLAVVWECSAGQPAASGHWLSTHQPSVNAHPLPPLLPSTD